MRTMIQIESLLRRNAEACEMAKRHRCTCACEGMLHGKPHTEQWIDETAQRLYAAALGDEQGDEDELDP
jgi:hypothetical protein